MRRKPKNPHTGTEKIFFLPADRLPCQLLISSPPNPHQLLGLSKSTYSQTSPDSLLRSKLESHHHFPLLPLTHITVPLLLGKVSPLQGVHTWK